MTSHRAQPLFPRAETRLLARFRLCRKRGRKVTERWICANARELVREEYEHHAILGGRVRTSN